MSISAERFKFLDKQTSVPVKALAGINDNSTYNAPVTKPDGTINITSLVTPSEFSKILQDIAHPQGETDPTLIGMARESANKITENLRLDKDTPVTQQLYALIQKSDPSGYSDALAKTLGINLPRYCNNQGTIDYTSRGRTYTDDILKGISLNTYNEKLNKMCKPNLKDELKKLKKDILNNTIKKRIETLLPNIDTIHAKEDILAKFITISKDYYKKMTMPSWPTLLTTSAFVAEVVAGNTDAAILNLKNNEISDDQREDYSAAVEAEFFSHLPSDPATAELFKARSELLKMVPISTTRRDNNIRYSDLNNQMGGLAKDVQTVDVDSIRVSSSDPGQTLALAKLKDFKTNTGSSADAMTRNKNNGNYDTYDFSSAMTVSDPADLATLNNTSSPPSTSHRYRNLSPTVITML